MAIIDRVRAALTIAGIAVRNPGEHEGKCTAPYVVLYDGGVESTGRATGMRVISINVYAPSNSARHGHDALRNLQVAVNEALRGVDGLRARGSPAPEAIDDAYGAHTMTIEYAALCAL